ncbi:MAG: class D beta-lactamase [Cytophagaceae bacterium]|nr:class D beta-lactamase [Cytophagaceae bacterium]
MGGSITLYNATDKAWIYSKEADSKVPSNPASTFKIINALIALEEGILKDEKQIIKFVGIENVDTVYYGNRTDIFKDMDLEEAFKKSAVWFNLEIAKKVGREKYKKYITASGWGNMDFSEPGLDFWNFGPFKVTPVQQIDFLKKLYEGKLGFSKRNLDIVKKIMIAETTPQYTIRGKTGWATNATEDMGWWVGYVERQEGVVFFATRTRKQKMDKNPNFVPCRKTITTAVLKQLSIIK